MHSTRMHTAHSSSHLGGLHQATPQDQTSPGTRHPPGPDTPQDQTPWTRHPLGPGTPWDQAPPRTRPPGPDLLRPGTPCGQTHTCKHITLPQTSFAGSNNRSTGLHCLLYTYHHLTWNTPTYL